MKGEFVTHYRKADIQKQTKLNKKTQSIGESVQFSKADHHVGFYYMFFYGEGF
jgi:hypothetical protein